MTERRYIPLGTDLTAEEAAGWSLRDLKERSLYDPRYAGLDIAFDWRHYVTVDMQDAEFRTQVETALNQFSRTPEGQQILRQALANRVFERTGNLPTNQELSSASLRAHRTMITDYVEENGVRLPIEASTYLDGVIGLSREEIQRMEYETADHGFSNGSVQDALFHELTHGADGLTALNLHAIYEANPDSASVIAQARATLPELANVYMDDGGGRELLAHYAAEYASMRTSSEYLGRYYGAEPQLLYIKSFRNDTDGGAHFYEDIILPPVSTPAPTDNSKERQR